MPNRDAVPAAVEARRVPASDTRVAPTTIREESGCGSTCPTGIRRGRDTERRRACRFANASARFDIRSPGHPGRSRIRRPFSLVAARHETGGKRRNLEKKNVDGPDPEARPSSVRAALLTDATGLRYHAPPCSSASRPCPRGAFPGSLAPREPSSRESFRLGVPNGAFHAAVPRTRRGRGPPADSHEALARPRGATRRDRALPVRVAPRLLCRHPARPRTPTDRTSSKKTRLGRTEIPRRRRLPSSRCCLTSAPPSKAAPPPGPRR
jgi:hypothetical protein